MFRLQFVLLAFVSNLWVGILWGQESLELPTDEKTKASILQAAEWLVGHVKKGSLPLGESEQAISVIAWKDPTLSPENPEQLAGYAITDTLWASYALSLTHPKVAEQLQDSLELLDCSGNSLHEVIWRGLEKIAHKPVDDDIVHGRSIGLVTVGGQKIDVRTFTMDVDRDFEIGHPALFAEHAVYQSIYESRLGKHRSARDRLQAILRGPTEFVPQVFWDQQRGLLVDYVTTTENPESQSGKSKCYRQYSFKLAILYYGSCLLGLNREYPDELARIAQRLRAAQLESGGVAHFFDVDLQSDQVHRCADPTGEATAIFMLALTLVPR